MDEVEEKVVWMRAAKWRLGYHYIEYGCQALDCPNVNFGVWVWCVKLSTGEFSHVEEVQSGSAVRFALR